MRLQILQWWATCPHTQIYLAITSTRSLYCSARTSSSLERTCPCERINGSPFNLPNVGLAECCQSSPEMGLVVHNSLGTHQNTRVVPGLPYCPWLETLQTPHMEAALSCAVAKLLIGLNFLIKWYEVRCYCAYTWTNKWKCLSSCCYHSFGEWELMSASHSKMWMNLALDLSEE